jgi:predicted transposase/invertase (TIGR01784 family)
LAKIRLDDTDDPIDICLDNVFKAVFTRDTPESQGALSRLLSALIGQELAKLDKVITKPIGEMTASEHWAIFFRYLTDKSKRRTINEILEQEEGIAMASEVLMSISRDEAERARLMSEFKYQMDTQSKIGYARREGREEGRQEVARRLKSRGHPLAEIAEDTGLDIAVIREL